MTRRIVPWLGIAAVLIGYPLLAHYTNESAHGGNLGALVADCARSIDRTGAGLALAPALPHAGCAGAVGCRAVG